MFAQFILLLAESASAVAIKVATELNVAEAAYLTLAVSIKVTTELNVALRLS